MNPVIARGGLRRKMGATGIEEITHRKSLFLQRLSGS
jgi:hypothetical protein